MKRISEDQHWEKKILYEYMPVRFQEIYQEQIRKKMKSSFRKNNIKHEAVSKVETASCFKTISEYTY